MGCATSSIELDLEKSFHWSVEKKGADVEVDGVKARAREWQTVCTEEIIGKNDPDCVLSFGINSRLERSHRRPYVHFGGFANAFPGPNRGYVGNQEGGYSWGSDFYVYSNAKAKRIPPVQADSGGFQTGDVLSVIFSPRKRQLHWFRNGEYHASLCKVKFPLQPAVTLYGGGEIVLEEPTQLDLPKELCLK